MVKSPSVYVLLLTVQPAEYIDHYNSGRPGGTGQHCITAYVQGGCVTGSEMFTITGENGQCANVITGTNVFSIRCAPNNLCEL